MALIIENRPLGEKTFLLTLTGVEAGHAGQFYMLKPGHSSAPFLPRPISMYDAQDGNVKLLIEVFGEGTAMLCACTPGSQIDITGPHGNGFPHAEGDIVLVGGAAGAAPLYYLAKELRAIEPNRRILGFVGFNGKCEPSEFIHDAMREVCDEVHMNYGGFVTRDVDYSLVATYFACGPDPMMRDCHACASKCSATLYVSMDERMACGVGACLCCVCHTKSGPKRSCKDGPVFLSSEVYYE